MSLTCGERLLLVLVCLAGLLATLWACTPMRRALAGLAYPPAPRGSAVDNYHGTPVADPYRWLEDLDSPQTRAWLGAEARLTQGYLQQIPERARIRARIEQLYDFVRTGVPFSENGLRFFTSNDGQQEQSVLFATRDAGEAPAVVLDPNVLPDTGHPIVTGYVASREARLVLLGEHGLKERVAHLALLGSVRFETHAGLVGHPPQEHMVFEREVSEQLLDELQHRGEPDLAVLALDASQ